MQVKVCDGCFISNLHKQCPGGQTQSTSPLQKYNCIGAQLATYLYVLYSCCPTLLAELEHWNHDHVAHKA